MLSITCGSFKVVYCYTFLYPNFEENCVRGAALLLKETFTVIEKFSDIK